MRVVAIGGVVYGHWLLISAKCFPADNLAQPGDRHDADDPAAGDDDGCQVSAQRRPAEQGGGRILGAGYVDGRDGGDDLLQRGDASAAPAAPGPVA